MPGSKEQSESSRAGVRSRAPRPWLPTPCPSARRRPRPQHPARQVGGAQEAGDPHPLVGVALSRAAHMGQRLPGGISAGRPGSPSPQGLAGSACRLAGSCSQTALNIACSHTVAGIELVAPEHGPHTRQGTEQLSAPVPGRGGRGGGRLPQPRDCSLSSRRAPQGS